MKGPEPAWARYTRSAVGAPTRPRQGEPQQGRPGSLRRILRGHARSTSSAVVARLGRPGAQAVDQAPRQRPDIRLLPAAAATWGSAVLVVGRPTDGAAALWWGTAALLGCLLFTGLSAHRHRQGSHAGRRRPHQGRLHHRGGRRRWGKARETLAASAPTIALAALCLGAVLLSSGIRTLNSTTAPLAQALARGQPLVLVLELTDAPRPLGAGSAEPRQLEQQVRFTAAIVQATVDGHAVQGSEDVSVVADAAWAGLRAGDRATTAGSVKAAAGAAAGTLHPATVPQNVVCTARGAQQAVLAVRAAWLAAVHGVWGAHNADVAGLLPGMVMGERNGLAPALNESMKTVGLTHLTAVSGANCTLVLASLLLLLRTIRAPRWAAFAASLAGLGIFVLVVGPDPSVLRAAVMGSIGAMALLSGRPKRVGALLAVVVVLLLLIDPWLATDFAFILSVLATLGLHLLGRRCVRWLAVWLPLWLAQAVAIPLAAQLFCAPVIVLLQARFTPYTLPANMLAAPVVVLVTTVGTLGLAVAVVIPPLGGLCAAVAGTGSWWVAAVARTMAAWPGSSLPWPEGMQGVALMALCQAAVVVALAAAVDPQRALAVAGRLSALLPPRWRRHGWGLLAGAAAAVTAWWSLAVLSS